MMARPGERVTLSRRSRRHWDSAVVNGIPNFFGKRGSDRYFAPVLIDEVRGRGRGCVVPTGYRQNQFSAAVKYEIDHLRSPHPPPRTMRGKRVRVCREREGHADGRGRLISHPLGQDGLGLPPKRGKAVIFRSEKWEIVARREEWRELNVKNKDIGGEGGGGGGACVPASWERPCTYLSFIFRMRSPCYRCPDLHSGGSGNNIPC